MVRMCALVECSPKPLVCAAAKLCSAGFQESKHARASPFCDGGTQTSVNIRATTRSEFASA